MDKTISLQGEFANWVYEQVIRMGVSKESALLVKLGLLISTLILVATLIDWISRKTILMMVKKYAQRANHPFLDILVEKKTFKILGHIIPLVFINVFLETVLYDFNKYILPMERFMGILMIIAVHQFLKSVLQVLKVVLQEAEALKDKPIASFIQVGGILISALGLLFGISVITGKSILSLVTAVGAMSAVLILVFKDVLSGLAASVRISTNDMLRVGDWVEFSKYGADGHVLDINLSTVKIQNFDHTITTIPTTAFTTDAFKNWRGMEDSVGRRIKRAVSIKLSSVHFCDNKMLEKFKSNPLLKEYIHKKEIEIDLYNSNIEKNGNGIRRQLTNLGLFRVY
jgi:miniconductance mechanosensitive channel